MDVTGNNFWRALPIMLDAISRADFLAFDLEFSGVVVNKAEAVSGRVQRSVEEAYEDARAVVGTFQLLQVGLTCVAYSKETSSTTASAVAGGC